MKKIFYLLLILLSGTLLKAQPILTSSSNGPQAGQSSITYLASSAPSPGDGGANQNWDFSAATLTGQSGVEQWFAPSSTPYAGNFPSANVVLLDGGSYEYVVSNSSGYSEIGYENDTAIGRFSDPQTALFFPFTFGDSTGDAFQALNIVDGDTDYERGSETVVADGYGSLKTPGGNYSNVLRTRSHIIIGDSTYDFFFGAFTDTSALLEYNYYVAGSSLPVMSIVYDTVIIFGGVFDVIPECVFLTPEATGVEAVSMLQQSLKVFPNPAMNKSTLEFTVKQQENISIELTNSIGEKIMSLTMGNQFAGKHRTPIDLNGLAAGEYLILVKTDKEGTGIVKMTID